MSKKRKTKKQKMAALSRHDFSTVLSASNTPQIKIVSKDSARQLDEKNASSRSFSHTYVAKDVRSTLMITLMLIALNIILFFILKLKFISFSGIVF